MINRLTTGWTWIRAAYLFIGLWVMIRSGFEGQWVGILLGAWPAAMGLFGLACAGGSCENGNCSVKPDGDHKLKSNK